MASLDDILARQQEMTSQLSSQTRTIALGFLAFAWALLTAHEEPLKTMAANAGQALAIMLSAFSVVVLVCDSFQYYFGAQAAKEAASRAEISESKEAGYDSRSFSYQMQWALYYLKQALLVFGFLLMVIIFVRLFKTPVKSAVPAPAAAAVVGAPVCCPQPVSPASPVR